MCVQKSHLQSLGDDIGKPLERHGPEPWLAELESDDSVASVALEADVRYWIALHDVEVAGDRDQGTSIDDTPVRALNHEDQRVLLDR